MIFLANILLAHHEVSLLRQLVEICKNKRRTCDLKIDDTFREHCYKIYKLISYRNIIQSHEMTPHLLAAGLHVRTFDGNPLETSHSYKRSCRHFRTLIWIKRFLTLHCIGRIIENKHKLKTPVLMHEYDTYVVRTLVRHRAHYNHPTSLAYLCVKLGRIMYVFSGFSTTGSSTTVSSDILNKKVLSDFAKVNKRWRPGDRLQISTVLLLIVRLPGRKSNGPIRRFLNV